MATGSTARRARFLSSALLLAACNGHGGPHSYNAGTLHLENRNGIVYQGQMPFSGRVFELDDRQDTVAVYGFLNGKEHGPWKRFHANGKLEELRSFQEGVKTGTLARWWPNGQLQFQCTFQRGEYEGPLKEWNESGQLVQEMHYRDGHEEGSQKMFYDNGKVRSNYVVKDGRRLGLLGTKNCINVPDSVFGK